jgi:excisionase family DNA binding protein
MVVFIANLSVAEAAKRLGVGVPRVHQRIADGSLRAERIGSQWVVDELSLLRVAERKSAGRPLSVRSAWALIALAGGEKDALADLAPVERARAKARLEELFAFVAKPPKSEEDVRRIAGVLRSWFRSRASRELYRAASADLPGLREDVRWAALGGLSAAASGIGAGDLVEGYLAEADAKSLSEDFLLVPAERDANVVVHVLPEGRRAYPDSRLMLAADLAEHRGPREERRAVEFLRGAGEMYRGRGR